MLKSIEGNFDHPEVNELLIKHFIELRAASPEGSAHVLDIPGLKVPSIKFWSLWENNKLMGCGALKFSVTRSTPQFSFSRQMRKPTLLNQSVMTWSSPALVSCFSKIRSPPSRISAAPCASRAVSPFAAGNLAP